MKTHPTQQQLVDFAAGTLGSDESTAIELHLEECDACCNRLEKLPDSLADALRRGPNSVGKSQLPDDPHRRVAGDTLSPAAALSPTMELELPADLKNHERYRVVRLLGAGGMGAVYQAEHRLMKRMVALKVIGKRLTADPEAVLRFRREVEAAARLDHPNIVRALDAEQTGDTHFLVMEYVDGLSLAQIVANNGPLPVTKACKYILQAAEGLQHAFDQGMVHRDIKPHNMMLTAAGTVKILDFGLARFISEAKRRTELTETGAIMGTPDFMAPEQAIDTRQADIRADIYSLGYTLYFLLSGRVPYPVSNAFQKLLAHSTEKPVALSTIRRGIPKTVLDVIEKMTAKDPSKRFQKPSEVVKALAQIVGPASAGGPGDTGPKKSIGCPGCNRSYTYSAQEAGQRRRCSVCSEMIEIPLEQKGNVGKKGSTDKVPKAPSHERKGSRPSESGKSQKPGGVSARPSARRKVLLGVFAIGALALLVPAYLVAWPLLEARLKGVREVTSPRDIDPALPKKGAIRITEAKYATPDGEALLPGKTYRIAVIIERGDFQGHVRISLKNSPKGVESITGTIPTEKTTGEIQFSISSDADPIDTRIVVVAESDAHGISTEISRPFKIQTGAGQGKAEPILPKIALLHNVRVSAVLGRSTELKIKVQRTSFNGTVSIALIDLPLTVAAKPIELAGGQTDASLIVDVSPNADCIRAKGTIVAKANGLEDVKSPVTLDIEIPMVRMLFPKSTLVLASGESKSFTLDLELQEFNGSVTLDFMGIPKGVTVKANEIRNRAKLSYRFLSLHADGFHSSIRHDTHCV